MKTLKASTKAGQAIIEKAERNIGYYLTDVYTTYSTKKLNSWKWCYSEFIKTDKHEDFHICSCNSYGYTVAWKGYYNERPIVRMETKDNTYIVFLDC